MADGRDITEADMQAWEQYAGDLVGVYADKIATVYHKDDATTQPDLTLLLTDFGEKLVGKNHELLGSKIPTTSSFMGRLAIAVSVLRGKYNA